jgi:hypothetical protein
MYIQDEQMLAARANAIFLKINIFNFDNHYKMFSHFGFYFLFFGSPRMNRSLQFGQTIAFGSKK